MEPESTHPAWPLRLNARMFSSPPIVTADLYPETQPLRAVSNLTFPTTPRFISFISQALLFLFHFVKSKSSQNQWPGNSNTTSLPVRFLYTLVNVSIRSPAGFVS